MKGIHLGELEELVLLTVGILYPEAYGVAVMDQLKEQADRRLNISAIHAVLSRLEDKGLLTSEMSNPTGERGGRRKRIFSLTQSGKAVLSDAVELRNTMYSRIPKVALKFSMI